MTSVSQRQKVKSVNETQSLALMRNMFRLSISAICYSRNLFPDYCFVKKPYGADELPTIYQLESAHVDENGGLVVLNEDAFQLTQWMEKGVFEALKHKYVKTVCFQILQGDEDDPMLLETYTFEVAYAQVGEKSLPTLNGVVASRENLKKQACTFIRNLTAFTSSLDVVPDERYLSMKVTYREDITPSDYEPEFFVPQNSQNHYQFPINQKVLRIKIGQLSSDHHTMALRFAHTDSMFDDMKSVNEVSSTISSINAKPSAFRGNSLMEEEKRDQRLQSKKQTRVDLSPPIDPPNLSSFKSLNLDEISSPLEMKRAVRDHVLSSGAVNMKVISERFKISPMVTKDILSQLEEEKIVNKQGKSNRYAVNKAHKELYNSKNNQDGMKELSEAASMVEAQRQENDGYTVIKNNSLVELEDVQSFSENEVTDEECHKPPFRSDHIRRSGKKIKPLQLITPNSAPNKRKSWDQANSPLNNEDPHSQGSIIDNELLSQASQSEYGKCSVVKHPIKQFAKRRKS